MISASSPCACPEDETFHDQVAERRERAVTLPASNLDFVELGDACPANKMMGAATLDRFRHGAYHAVLDVASYRSPKSLPLSAGHFVARGGKITHA